jgi:hypothetical protein
MLLTCLSVDAVAGYFMLNNIKAANLKYYIHFDTWFEILLLIFIKTTHLTACPTRKKMYSTEAVAEEALISAWITYQYKGGNGPIGVYLCEECGSYHLTSKGAMNTKLEEYIALGKIERGADVEAWLDKIRRKR